MTAILHVDDSHLARTIVRVVLNGRGYEIIGASDGMEGLDAARRHRPDAIIAGLDLPALDGIGLIESLRSDHDETPVILVTACARESTLERCWRAGAAAVIDRANIEHDLPAMLDATLESSSRSAA